MRGVAAVEFGLMLPILILLFFGIVEYGRMLYQYNTLVKSVRDGARYISVYSPLDMTNYSTHLDEAKKLVVFGNKKGSGSALVAGLNENMVYITSVTQTTIALVPISVKTVTVAIKGFSLGYITKYFTSIPLSFGGISITMRQAES